MYGNQPNSSNRHAYQTPKKTSKLEQKMVEEMHKAAAEGTYGLDFMDEDSELGKKCLNNIDNWMKEDNDDVFNGCLKKLGLCERKGLDGQLMLYPVKSKERKLEKEEFLAMMKKLYTIKDTSNDLKHLNDKSQQDITKNAEFSKRMNQVHVDYSRQQMQLKMERAREQPVQPKKKAPTPIANIFDFQ